jgi:hypothetical protein
MRNPHVWPLGGVNSVDVGIAPLAAGLGVNCGSKVTNPPRLITPIARRAKALFDDIRSHPHDTFVTHGDSWATLTIWRELGRDDRRRR